jgi:hypothetical protein
LKTIHRPREKRESAMFLEFRDQYFPILTIGGISLWFSLYANHHGAKSMVDQITISPVKTISRHSQKEFAGFPSGLFLM